MSRDERTSDKGSDTCVMKREPILCIEDIKNCIESIENYTCGMTLEDFLKNEMIIDAVESRWF